MKLNKNALESTTEGLSEKLIAAVTGDGDKTVTWSSNNPSVAAVDANGRVTAVKEGTAVITATVGQGGDLHGDGFGEACAAGRSARGEAGSRTGRTGKSGDGGNTDGS